MNGRIVSIRGQVVEVEFPGSELPRMHQLLEVQEGKHDRLLEVHGYREGHIVQSVALGSVIGLRRSLDVVPLPDRELLHRDILGYVVDGVGRVMIDRNGRQPSESHSVFTRSRKAAHHRNRGPARALEASKTIDTHILAIDVFAPIIRGSKVGILGGAGVGKTVLMTAIAQAFLEREEKGVAVFAGVGERIREAQELFSQQFENLKDRCVFVFGQMDRNAGERFRAAHTAVEIAEHLRDEKKHVLLFMDNVFRFVQAGAEISTMLGRMPSVLGYQPTLELELGELEERICSFENSEGSITSIQCVYMPSDDLTDPAINAITRHMATTIVLDRDIERYPKMDVLRSKTRIEGAPNSETSKRLRKILQRKKDLETKIHYHLANEEELTFYERATRVESKLKQDYRHPADVQRLGTTQDQDRRELEALLREAEGK